MGRPVLVARTLLFAVACVVLAPGAAAEEAPRVYRDPDGSLHVNSAANQTVLINGEDVLARLAAAEARLEALLARGQLNNNGSMQWSDTAGASGYDQGVAIACDRKGQRVYVAGFSEGTLDPSNPNTGGRDMLLLAYDAAGTRLWARQLSAVSDSHVAFGEGVAVDDDGSVYVAGWASAAVIGGGVPAGERDALLVKYDKHGQQLWLRQLGSEDYDYGWDVAVGAGPDADIYLVGRAGRSLDGQHFAGVTDAFVAKFSSSGTKQWTRQLGTPGADDAFGATVDHDGNVLVTGSTSGLLHPGGTSAGETDIFLAKYSADGVLLWARQCGQSMDDRGNSVAVDADNNIYVAGEVGVPDAEGMPMPQAALAKFRANGDREFLIEPSGSTLNGVVVDSSSNVFVTGGGSFVTKLTTSGDTIWTRSYSDVFTQNRDIAVDESNTLFITGMVFRDSQTDVVTAKLV